jgi:hypothetical protein
MITKKEEWWVTLLAMVVSGGLGIHRLPYVVDSMRQLNDVGLAVAILVISVSISFVVMAAISIERNRQKGRLVRSWIGITLVMLIFVIGALVPLDHLASVAYQSLVCGFLFAVAANALASQLSED